MRILIVNSVCGIRSTGRICTDLAEKFLAEGHKVKIAYGRETVPSKYKSIAKPICNKFQVYFSAFKARLFDNEGFNCKKTTKKFLEWADKYNPDIIWLHNLHGYYLNIELLFNWIKSRPNMQVKWTLHDCWAFTGHCTYFTMAGCDKWKTKCTTCPQFKKYPTSILKDNCSENFNRKKEIFTGVKNMTLITPSKWLADIVKQSFLKEYAVKVVNNTIDKNIFKPTPSNFRKKYGLQGKKIILGVASIWDERKGLDDFVKLSDMLDENYAIVLVGISSKQIKNLPKKIIAILQTNSATELAEIYTAADVFFNPTYEDNYPTVNLEAQACSTPCITYNIGGSGESVPLECVTEKGDLKKVLEIIETLTK